MTPVVNDGAEWAVTVRREGDGAVLHAVGELDLDSAPGLLAEVTGLLDDGARRLVLDLAELTFIDSSGLGTLVGCWRRTQQAGGELSLANAGDDVALTLRITGLDQVLPVQRTAG